MIYKNKFLPMLLAGGLLMANGALAVPIVDHGLSAGAPQLTVGTDAGTPNAQRGPAQGAGSAAFAQPLNWRDRTGVANVGNQVTGVTPPAAIPEPSTLLLLGLGIAGVAAVRLRRDRRI